MTVTNIAVVITTMAIANVVITSTAVAKRRKNKLGRRETLP